MIGINEARPPLVVFKRESVKDQAASMEAGRAVFKNVNTVEIAQPPGKDWTVKNADKWLAQIKEDMLQGRRTSYPPEWVDGFHRAYKNWLDGVDGNVPEGETALRDVPFVTPAEADNYAQLYIYSIEAAAAMTEDTLKAAGMGSRMFRDKCRAFLETAQKGGKVAEEVAHLKREVQKRDDVIAAMEKRLSALEADEVEAPRRGRKPKLQEAA